MAATPSVRLRSALLLDVGSAFTRARSSRMLKGLVR